MRFSTNKIGKTTENSIATIKGKKPDFQPDMFLLN